MIRGTYFLALTLAISAPWVVLGQEACQGLDVLGTPNWDRLDGELRIEVDDDCQFTWMATFKHNETLPVPDDPATQCNPTVDPPVLASDGLPFYAFRWHYVKTSDYFKQVTGIDHISLDFNPCGHPPIGIFTIPHYDMHAYRVTPEFRSCMTCDLLPGAPVCDFTPGAQTTESGIKFFNPITRNIPPRFLAFQTDNVPVMGGHAWDPATQPASAANWTEPMMVTGYYDDEFLYYEPMPPLSFVTGDTDNFWELEISYENQTIDELATYVSVGYNATTGVTTFTYRGPSAVCETESPTGTPGGTTGSPTNVPDESGARGHGMQALGFLVSMCLAVTYLVFN